MSPERNQDSAISKVATVNKNGKIVGKKKGKAKITVIMQSGKKASCTVKVTKVKKAGIVYVTATGIRYHCKKNCPGLRNANALYTVSKKEAVDEGYSPCKICYK